MTATLDRVLIPVDVSESSSLGRTLINAVPMKKAVLLGYWPIPDQSAPDQPRDQFEEEAQLRLQTIADRLIDNGGEVETRLVFTKDRAQLIDTATNKYECQSVLIPGTETPRSGTTRGIVLIKPNADLDRIVTTLGALFAESDVELHLFHVVESTNEHLYDATEYMLRGIVDRLTEVGICRDRIEWEQPTNGKPTDVILSRISDFDFVVMGETKPALRERIFGTIQSEVANKTAKPLLTIRTSE